MKADAQHPTRNAWTPAAFRPRLCTELITRRPDLSDISVGGVIKQAVRDA